MNKRKKIDLFWQWFSTHTTQIADLYKAKAFQKLTTLLSSKLNSIDRDLPWEIGPGARTKYSFTLSPEGNVRLERLVREVLSRAPQLNEWEIHSSRQPRKAPAVVRLPAHNLSFSTRAWRFIPAEDREQRRINITVIGDDLRLARREESLKAVSIFLDQFLGERTVEDCIGRIRIAGEQSEGKSYPIRDLRDYLLWARNREKNPLILEVRQ